MEEILKINTALNDLEQRAGWIAVILVIFIGLSAVILYRYLKSFVEYWASHSFKHELERYKNELNLQLGSTIVEKLSTVNKEIAILKDRLDISKQRILSYHSEALLAHRNVFTSINLLYQELTDPHHGAVDQWNGEALRERVAYLTSLNRKIDVDISTLKLYSEDHEFHLEIFGIHKLLIDKAYTPPKQFLLKIRAWLPKYTLSENKEEEIKYKDELQKEYNENLLAYKKDIASAIHDFQNLFRSKYWQLINSDSET